jgi:hypothetical protein
VERETKADANRPSLTNLIVDVQLGDVETFEEYVANNPGPEV